MSVQGASVNREWTILSHACTTAMKDWRWLRHNPFKEATRPSGNPARTRRPAAKETEALLHALSCDPHVTPTTKIARVGFAYLFAIETAMREGEIAELRRSDLKGKVAHLRKTKNGDERDVPLSKEALRLLSLLPWSGETDALVFQLTAAQIDSLFRIAKDKALVDDLHFHDTRREALTRMAKKVDVLTLAKISGHRDLRILLNTYYKPDMQDVAKSLD
jgi:integrase